MGTNYSITEYFGSNLAELLSQKFLPIFPQFNHTGYVEQIEELTAGKTYTERVEIHADILKKLLPDNYKKAAEIIVSILGPENPNETGMFTNFYWVLPLGKYVEKFGLEDYTTSINAIEEITKRNTGEYAIRPFIREFPEETLKCMRSWAKSENFHLRRLSSEGLRPKLPWAKKLDTFNENPTPVFEILELLKEDKVMFVKKSVANHFIDWMKVKPDFTKNYLLKWFNSENQNTKWIINKIEKKFPLNS